VVRGRVSGAMFQGTIAKRPRRPGGGVLRIAGRLSPAAGQPSHPPQRERHANPELALTCCLDGGTPPIPDGPHAPSGSRYPVLASTGHVYPEPTAPVPRRGALSPPPSDTHPPPGTGRFGHPDGTASPTPGGPHRHPGGGTPPTPDSPLSLPSSQRPAREAEPAPSRWRARTAGGRRSFPGRWRMKAVRHRRVAPLRQASGTSRWQVRITGDRRSPPPRQRAADPPNRRNTPVRMAGPPSGARLQHPWVIA